MRAEGQFLGRGVLVLVVPYLVYVGGMAVGGALEQVSYPVSYAIGVGVTLLLCTALWRGYALAPFSINRLSVAVGVLGVVVWIGLWRIDRDVVGIGAHFGPTREAFNPFDELGDTPLRMWAFLAVRFTGLVAVVPVVEEFFVRGFLMRYLDAHEWDQVPLGTGSWRAVVGVAVYALVSHPAEPLAAVVWFGLITWWYLRTRSIWDCVLAHATTNLLLGLYVVGTGTWALW